MAEREDWLTDYLSMSKAYDDSIEKCVDWIINDYFPNEPPSAHLDLIRGVLRLEFNRFVFEQRGDWKRMAWEFAQMYLEAFRTASWRAVLLKLKQGALTGHTSESLVPLAAEYQETISQLYNEELRHRLSPEQSQAVLAIADHAERAKWAKANIPHYIEDQERFLDFAIRQV